MYAVAKKSGKKTWQTRRHLVSVEAALAIQRENVMNRLVRLREEIGHPEKPDKPLPQDQAAARAGVTVRQWQRWESGQSVPYARNLSEVADAFGFDVGEFYDGPAGKEPAPTPSPFVDRDDRIESALAEFTQAIRKQNELLARQSAVLERIERALSASEQTRTEADESTQRLLDAAAEAGRILRDGAPRPAAKHGKQATSR